MSKSIQIEYIQKNYSAVEIQTAVTDRVSALFVTCATMSVLENWYIFELKEFQFICPNVSKVAFTFP
jgi:hypothetical protein